MITSEYRTIVKQSRLHRIFPSISIILPHLPYLRSLGSTPLTIFFFVPLPVPLPPVTAAHSFSYSEDILWGVKFFNTSNNQRLWSAGDIDQRLKRFCSINDVLWISFKWYKVKTCEFELHELEGPNAWDHISVLYIPFILRGSPNKDSGP